LSDHYFTPTKKKDFPSKIIRENVWNFKVPELATSDVLQLMNSTEQRPS